MGPFTIKEVLSPITYRLNLPKTWKIHNVFHANLLSKFTENDIHGPNPEPPIPDVIEGQEEYEVEGIIDHRIQKNQQQYFVKWKGYDHYENSWEPEENLLPHAQDILKEYQKEHDLTPYQDPYPNTHKRKTKKQR